MGFVWHIAFRYFRSTRADAHIRLLSTLTAGGLAVGTAALVLALASLSGFQALLLEEMERHTPALQLELRGTRAPDAANSASGVPSLTARAAAVPGVEEVQELLYARGWLVDRSGVLPIEVIGYERSPPAFVVGPDAAAGAGADGLILPSAVARRVGVRVGDAVRVVSPRPGLTPVGPRPRTRTLPVAGVYRSAREDVEELPVLLRLEQAEVLFVDGDRRLDLVLGSRQETERVAAALRPAAEAAGAKLTTWRQANRALLFVLRLEKALMFSAVALIVAVASFALLAALSLVVSSKQAEVGVLAAMGAAPSRIERAFLALGALLSVGGAALGGGLGAGLAALFDRYRLIPTPSDVFIVDYLPFLVRLSDVLAVILTTVVFTTVAAFVGARRASQLDPIVAMRSARA